MYETLTFEISDHVAHVVFNRPRLRNAMNATSWRELGEVFNRIRETPEARVAVLSSTGPHFCAGIDLKSLGSLLDTPGEIDEGRRMLAVGLAQPLGANDAHCVRPTTTSRRSSLAGLKPTRMCSMTPSLPTTT